LEDGKRVKRKRHPETQDAFLLFLSLGCLVWLVFIVLLLGPIRLARRWRRSLVIFHWRTNLLMLSRRPAHCVAEDDSSLDAADSVPDDSPVERLAAPSSDARCAPAAPKDDSCPAGCRLAADCLAPDDSAAQKAIDHCARAAQTDGYLADCSETAGLAEIDTPDSAGLVQADSAAQTVIDHCARAAQTDGYLADCSETAGLAEADTLDSAGSVQAGSVAVD
jgi:hypothetical protein